MRTKRFIAFRFMSRTKVILALIVVMLGTILMSSGSAREIISRAVRIQQSNGSQRPASRQGRTVGTTRKTGAVPSRRPGADSKLAIVTTTGSTNAAVILRHPDLGIPSPEQTPISGMPANAHPFGIAFVGSDEALVTNANASQIFLIRISTDSVIDIIDTAPNYDGTGTIAASPGADYIFAASGSKLFLKQGPINLGASGTSIALPGTVGSQQTQAVAFDGDGRAFVYSSAGISVLDPPYTGITFTIPFANSGGSIAISPDGNGLLVTDLSDTLKIFKGPFSVNSTPTTLKVSGTPSLDGIAITPDGNQALVSSAAAPHLFTVQGPFSAAPASHDNGLPSNLAAGIGFGDIAVSSDGEFAIGTGFASAVSNAPAAFIQAPFDSPSISEVTLNGSSRGSGSVRFIPEEFVPGGSSNVTPNAGPDLQITKTHNGDFTPGQTGVYTIVVTNVGTASTTGPITVADVLPAGFNFVSGTGGGGCTATNAQIVTCTNNGVLAVNGTETITLTVGVPVGVGTSSVVNTASVSTAGDTNPANDNATDPTNIFTKSWVGGDNAGPTDWSNPNNWTPVGVPTATDNVSISSAPTLPVLSTNVSVGDLTVNANATVNTSAHVLTATGSVDATGGIVGTGSVNMVGNGKSLKGGLTTTTINGTISANGSIVVSGAMTVSAGQLTLNGHSVQIGKDFTTSGTGFLDMENSSDQLTVTGNMIIQGNTTSGKLTAGSISLTGNFSENSAVSSSAFAASGTNKVILNGGSAQTISFANPGKNGFQDIQLNNAAGAMFTTDATINGTASITQGTFTSSNATTVSIGGNLVDSVGGRWQAQTTNFTGSPSLPTSFTTNALFSGNAVLTNSFTVTGNVGVSGSFTLNGQSVNVAGGFTTIGTGTFTMQNAADQLIVQGIFVASGGNSTGKLTNGVIKVAGNFSENGGATSFAFAASGSNTVQLNGTTQQTVSFKNASSNGFQNLEVDNPAGVVFLTDVQINGTATVSGGTVTSGATTVTTIGGDLVDTTNNNWQATTTIFTGSPALPLTFTTNATFSGRATVSNDFTVIGTLTVTGNLNLNGHTVFTLSDFSTSQNGTFTMGNPNDHLLVDGTLHLSGDTTSGQLTAGVIRVLGNILEDSSISTSAFAPSGTNKVQLNGEGGQSISFSHPTTSGFNDLEILNASSPGISLNSDVLLTGQLISNTATIFGNGHALTMAGFTLNGLTIDNATVTSNGGTPTELDNVTFQNEDPTATQLTVNHPGAATAFTFNNNQFLTTPTTGFFVKATDTVSDANVLTLNFFNSVPFDGSAHTSTVNGAIVNWQIPAGIVDLALTKTHTGNFTVGTNGVYNFGVTNNGSGSTLEAITITDNLPAGLTFINATGNGSCSAVAASQTVTCTVTGPLASGAVANIAMTVAVGAAAAPNVTNTATVSTFGDSNQANNSASDFTTVVFSSDIALAFNVGPNPVIAGNNLTYTLGVSNNGPSPASAVALTLPLPPNVSFVSATAAQGSCSPSTTVVTCTVGNLSVNANDAISIVVKALSGPFTTSASVTGAQPDPNPGNNSASTTITVNQPPAILAISKTAPQTAQTGTNFTYTLSFSNTGGDATGVTISDLLPNGVTFVSATNGGSFANGVVTWGIGTLLAGANGSVSFTVTVTATSGTIVNSGYSIQANGVSPVSGQPVSTTVINNLPTVTTISPNTGPAAGNTAVLITGSNFQATGAGTPKVTFGNGSATNVLVISDTVITANTPPGTGSVNVTVTTGNGSSTSNVVFTYTTAAFSLAVSQVSPSQAPEAGGTPIKVLGVGFANPPSTVPANVLFGGKPATNVVVVSDTEIDCTSPSGTGIVDVAVSNNNGTSRLAGAFTYLKSFPNNVTISWRAPNDASQPLPPPRDVTAASNTPTNGGSSASSIYSAWTDVDLRWGTSDAEAATSATPDANVVIGYNVYRGFAPDFSTSQPLPTDVTKIGNTAANQTSITDSAAVLAAAQANGFGVPFYRITALYQTPNGIVESAPSETGAPTLTITNVSDIPGTGSGRTIHIDGVGFATFRAIVEINGVQFTTVTFPAANRLENGTSTSVELSDPNGTLIPVGSQVKITILNPGLTAGSGDRSKVFVFQRLQ